MKFLITICILLLTACGALAPRATDASYAASECSKQTFRDLRQEIRRAEAAFKLLGVAADRDPSEANSAAAASAAADIAIAQANLAVAQAECP